MSIGDYTKCTKFQKYDFRNSSCIEYIPPKSQFDIPVDVIVVRISLVWSVLDHGVSVQNEVR